MKTKNAMKRRPVVRIGDFVRCGGIWRDMEGLVTATEKSWFMIDRHVEVNNSIVSRKDITLLERCPIPKKYWCYLNALCGDITIRQYRAAKKKSGWRKP